MLTADGITAPKKKKLKQSWKMSNIFGVSNQVCNLNMKAIFTVMNMGSNPILARIFFQALFSLLLK